MFFVIVSAGYHKHLYDKKKKQAAKKNQKAVCFLMTGSFSGTIRPWLQQVSFSSSSFPRQLVPGVI